MNAIMGQSMKKTTIVPIMLALAMFLVACQKDTSVFSGGVRGQESFSFSQTQTDEKTEYVLNTASRRIHVSDCSFVSKIKEENRLPCTDLIQAEAEGYTPCSQCFSKKTDTNREEEQTK